MSHHPRVSVYRVQRAWTLRAVDGDVTRQPAHHHEQYWLREAQYRYEERIGRDIEALEREVRRQGDRLTVIVAIIGFLAFVAPIVAPFLRSLVGL